jgi:hypothetical protein
LKLRDAWARVYKVFLSSASIESPLLAAERPGYHRALDDAYIETMFYAGVLVRKYADSVYSAAGEAIDSSVETEPVWRRLRDERRGFIQAIQGELREEEAESSSLL